MPDDTQASPELKLERLARRLDITERNVSDQASTLTAYRGQLDKMTNLLDELRVDREVRKERDKNLNEHLSRIERAIEEGLAEMKEDVNTRFKRLYWPVNLAAGAIITTLVAAIVTFIVRGGLNVAP